MSEVWPAAEVPETVNIDELGDKDEKSLVAFMNTLNDRYWDDEDNADNNDDY